MLQDQPFDFASLHFAYAEGTNPSDVIDECYRRLEAAGDPGIFLHVIDRSAVQTAVEALGPFSPMEKPLWGIPFAIKDNIDAAGTPTTAACPAFAYTAEKDAFVVAALCAAGAILIGKTNLDQFATGLVGVRSPYAPPKNALDPAIVPGGSSSGSAVAVARGIVGFALGTDTAGSGRVPAAMNRIVGLKPTLGTVSNSGVVPACRTLDTVSIFALNVADAHCVFRSAARFDPADPYARDFGPQPPLSPLPPRFRIGIPDTATRPFFGDREQAASFSRALEDIAALGGDIVAIDFTAFHQVSELLYDGPWVAERHAAIEDFLTTSPDEVHPVTRSIIEQAKRFSATDAFRGFYRLQELKREISARLSDVDALCVPSVPTFYGLADLAADPIGPNSRLGTYTNFVNLLDLCGLTVPVAARTDGRPGSVTLLAAAGRDAAIAALGVALHERCGQSPGVTGWAVPPPPTPPRAAAPDEIALAVVGAHMSGLPLNHELTRLGSRFLFAAKTAPVYRLYNLPGGPPYRPGLVRGATGSAVAIEVWAVPAARFGDFMRGIPAPLGIGTLTLEDGTDVKGFLCEADGTIGAKDVTRYGGWRAYLESLS